MHTNEMNIALPPDFQGKGLAVGSPQDFDQVRKTQKLENKRARVFTSVADLAAYLTRFGDKNLTTVYCTQSDIKAVLNEEEPVNEAKFVVEWSTAFKEWQNAFRTPFQQGGFKEFVERRQGDIVDGIRLLNAVTDLKLTTTIQHDGRYDDDHNYQVTFKEETGGESALKIPKIFQINIPLTNGDRFRYDLDIELKLRKPKNADEKFTFNLKCWALEDILNNAMEDRIAALKDALPGWHIYAGSPN